MILLIAFLFIFETHASSKEICPTIVMHDGEDINLTETEKNLICGDPDLESYQNIPSYQASYLLTGFLQSRSYLQPTFETKNKVLNVYVGKKSELKDVIVSSEIDKESKRVEKELNRLHGGSPLNPDLLNTLESDTINALRQAGYPCPTVEMLVDPNTSVASLNLGQMVYHDFGVLEREEIPGLRENALERYYPFKSKDTFNGRLLTLTEKRMLRAQVVQGTYFLESCTEEGKNFSLSQKFIVGPPRTFRFGAGASTEAGPMARLRWTHHRYKSMASILSANLQASLRNQSLTLTADSFFWKNAPRRSLLSEIEITRESQLDFEELIFKTRSQMKWTADYSKRHWLWTLGPSFEAGTFHSGENSSTRSYATGALEGGLQWMSHLYEFYDLHPEEGDLFNFNFGFRHPSLGFSDPLLELESSYVKLYRLTDWGRGSLVSGIRLNAGTTWVSNDVSLNSLPPSVKFYGGGSDDIRGFFLKTLPKNDGLGALTKIGGKFELRRTYLIRPTFEGFVFIDGAYFGDQSWSTEPRLWHSPGIGIRWISPIGLVQTYAARAYVSNPYEDLGNFYYIGLGGTF